MKQIALSIILSVVNLTVSGQQINQPTNCYCSGDILEKNQVTVKGFSLNGSNGVGMSRDCPLTSLKNFKTLTDHLETTDDQEKPGKVIIKDDLEQYNKNE